MRYLLRLFQIVQGISRACMALLGGGGNARCSYRPI